MTGLENTEAPAARGDFGGESAHQQTSASGFNSILRPGWKIFPCHSIVRGACTCGKPDCKQQGKHPRTRHGVLDATDDPAQVSLWRQAYPDANWGVACGPSDIWVLDIDPKHGGFDSLRDLGAMPDTLRVLTGGGGLHYYFQGDPVVTMRGGVLPGVDVRAGNSYVILPGGKHISGGTYVAQNPDADVLDAPLSLVAAVTSRSNSGTDSAPLRDAATILDGIPEGARDDTLFRWACRLRRQHSGDTDGGRSVVTALVLMAARNSGFPESEALAKVEQAFKQDHGDAVAVARDRLIEGGTFILDEPDEIPAVWGVGENVLWAEGEALMIAGHQGLGKTTIAQQVVLARIGVRDESFLGLPVTMSQGRVLYLAMDRPRQAARSFRRMVAPADRAVLDQRLMIWRGPLPIDPLKKGELGLWVREQCPDVDTIVIDSVKDLAPGVSDDAVGSALNSAWQELIADGIELLLLHHERKAGSGADRTPSLDNIYGSTWLTSGLGSVIALSGEPGSDQVKAHHVKQPAETVGPLHLQHDHRVGRTTVRDGVEMTVEQAITMSGPVGLDVQGMATLTGLSERTIRRQVKDLEEAGKVTRVEGTNRAGGRTRDKFRAVVAG